MMYSRRSNSRSLSASAGRAKIGCQMLGIQSTARWPKIPGSTGTGRQSRTGSPAFSARISNSFCRRARKMRSWGRKNMPTA